MTLFRIEMLQPQGPRFVEQGWLSVQRNHGLGGRGFVMLGLGGMIQTRPFPGPRLKHAFVPFPFRLNSIEKRSRRLWRLRKRLSEYLASFR